VGKSATSTLNEIEETRHRLEKDVAELTERLPAPAIWAKRLIGLAVGGGIGGSVFWFVVHRIRPVVQVIPADWGKGLEKLFESGEWKGPALAIGGVWLVLKLTELRRLRRLTRAMMAGR